MKAAIPEQNAIRDGIGNFLAQDFRMRAMQGSGVDPWAELGRLRQSQAELEGRVQELRAEVGDLQAVCAAKGWRYEEALAARRHRRSFAETCRADSRNHESA